MPTPAAASPIRAIVFDVFGTLVDWRSSVAHQAEALLAPHGVSIDWLGFADAWRACYQPAMEAVRSRREPYAPLDVLHRRNLDAVLQAFGLADVDAATRDRLNLAWHRLDAWRDVGPGLARLRQHFLLAPCSNGNVALMVDLARHNRWHWDAILGADLARDFKPAPAVYEAAVAAFACRPDEVMMVAAHASDLAAAAALGLRTAFVGRPDEHGPGVGERSASGPVDLEVSSLVELAERLSAPDASR